MNLLIVVSTEVKNVIKKKRTKNLFREPQSEKQQQWRFIVLQAFFSRYFYI